MEMPEDQKRRARELLGLRDFPQRTSDERKRMMGSDMRLAALEAIDTSTRPRPAKREMKKNVVLEVVAKKLLPQDLLKSNATVYIGSEMDVEYPLAFGARHIVLVDPVFTLEECCRDMSEKIKNLAGRVSEEGGRLKFSFDYGDGPEDAEVLLIGGIYSSKFNPEALGVPVYELPDDVGAILLFGTQSPGGVVCADENMLSKLVHGGVIVEETHIITVDEDGTKRRTDLSSDPQ